MSDNHTSLLITHLNRVLFNKTNHPDRVEASIAELRAEPYVSEAANELIALLGLLVAPTPVTEVVPLIPLIETPPMIFVDKLADISAKLDALLVAIKAERAPSTQAKSEVTSPKMAKLAAQVLDDPKATKRERSLAGALLTQVPNRA